MRSVRVAIVAALLVLAWQELVIHYYFDGQQSGLFCTGDLVPPPSDLRPGTYVFRHSPGYDGQFYRYVAHDPFFRRGYSSSIDNPAYRYGRILVPVLAWAAAGGRDALIDRTYQLVIAAFLALGVYWCATWFGLDGAWEWWGLLFLAVPATIASFDRMVLDGPLCALFAGFVVAAKKKSWGAAYAIAVAAPLVRETGAFLIAAAVVAALAARQWRRAGLFATAAIPFLAWQAYVAGRIPGLTPVWVLDRPVWGVLARVFTFRSFPLTGFLKVLATGLETMAAIGYVACLALAGVWLWRNRRAAASAVWLALAGFFALGWLLGNPQHLLEAYGYARPLSPLLLWLMVDAIARRAWLRLVPPLMVTQAVAMYLGKPLISIARGVL